MLPLWHYKSLIEQKRINPKGYYEIVVWKEGRLTKDIIDDYIEFDNETNKPIGFDLDNVHPWMLILLKMWAKVNNGYQNIYEAEPFGFLKTFSYPDWETINVNIEDDENLINKLSKVQSKEEYYVAVTKDDSNVG